MFIFVLLFMKFCLVICDIYIFIFYVYLERVFCCSICFVIFQLDNSIKRKKCKKLFIELLEISSLI